jgi:adenylate kinase
MSDSGRDTKDPFHKEEAVFYTLLCAERNMRIIIFGPQASGKGTQSEMLAKESGVMHISVGERLRQEAASGSALGKRMKERMDKGEMVSDDLVEKMIKRLIEESEGKFVLDGFPRTEAQARWLDLITRIDRILVLSISDKTAIERIGGRRECAKGHDFHLLYKPPKKENTCDECGLPLKKRADDTSVAIMKRLQLYHEQTEPMIKHYQDRIITIDGERSIPDVHHAILKALR